MTNIPLMFMQNRSPVVYGWRLWTVDTTDKAILRSPFVGQNQKGFPWLSRYFTATCRHPHTPPEAECMCGIYADPDPYLTLALGRARMLTKLLNHKAPDQIIVLGRVELFGSLLLDSRTTNPNDRAAYPEYRAEHACISALWVPRTLSTPPGPVLTELRLRYGVTASSDTPQWSPTLQPQPIPRGIPLSHLRGLHAPSAATDEGGTP